MDTVLLYTDAATQMEKLRCALCNKALRDKERKEDGLKKRHRKFKRKKKCTAKNTRS